MPGVKRSMMMAAGSAAAGGGEPGLNVEEVFCTTVYNGNGGPLTITNNIDLAGEGGMVWTKQRNSDYTNNLICDTVRGRALTLVANNTAVAHISPANYDYKSFNSDGYTIGTPYNMNLAHSNGSPYVNWTFREAPGFFDIVTYTGNSTGTGSQNIAHSLDSQIGFLAVRRLDAIGDWYCQWGTSPDHYYKLNSTSSRISDGSFWGGGSFTPTQFQVGGTASTTNINGATYVAYVWGAGGAAVGYGEGGGKVFGANGDEDIIRCGSYSGSGGSGANPFIDLGWEPQYVLIKCRTNNEEWYVFDSMRGMPNGNKDQWIRASSHTEDTQSSYTVIDPLPTGFEVYGGGLNEWNGNHTYEYMAIRRPMKVPTAGTQVFAADTRTSSEGEGKYDSSFPVDWSLSNNYDSVGNTFVASRLTEAHLQTNGQVAESSHVGDGVGDGDYTWEYMDGLGIGEHGAFFGGSTNNLNLMFRRAPGFMDVVCYTGTGTAMTVAHGLTVAPEMIFIKSRAFANWLWFYTGGSGVTFAIPLDGGTDNGTNASYPHSKLPSAPTATGFAISSFLWMNSSSVDYVSFLFASLDGVSKVGTYEGDGSSQDIDCGFSGGARFVLIKRCRTGGPMFIWNTERGIVTGDDPYLSLLSSAAEVTNTDYIDPHNDGFTVNVGNGSNLTDMNKSGGTYVFLAIA